MGREACGWTCGWPSGLRVRASPGCGATLKRKKKTLGRKAPPQAAAAEPQAGAVPLPQTPERAHARRRPARPAVGGPSGGSPGAGLRSPPRRLREETPFPSGVTSGHTCVCPAGRPHTLATSQGTFPAWTYPDPPLPTAPPREASQAPRPPAAQTQSHGPSPKSCLPATPHSRHRSLGQGLGSHSAHRHPFTSPAASPQTWEKCWSGPLRLLAPNFMWAPRTSCVLSAAPHASATAVPQGLGTCFSL